VAPARALADALICTTGTEYFQQSNRMSTWQRLGQQCRSLRGWSDCSALLLLCTGRIDGVVEPVMHPWDIGPFAAILPAAGAAWAALDDTDGAPGGSLAAASSQGLLTQILATA
jgi:fructose-1,6-bisphosphatase/inositol monophosphatase family enzyme